MAPTTTTTTVQQQMNKMPEKSYKKFGVVVLLLVLLIIALTLTISIIVLQLRNNHNNSISSPHLSTQSSEDDLDVSLTRVRKSNRHLIRSSMISRSGLSLKDDLDLNPLEINVNNIYTPWTRWSRCKKKCKQVRKRFCTLSAICGSNVLKEERPCSRGRCIRKKKKNNFHIIKKKKLSQRTRGFLKFNRAFYTRWTKWSQCSDTCKTLRSRSCKFSLVCGSSVIKEEAYCYTDGSKCEEWYKEGKYLRPSPDSDSDLSSSLSDESDTFMTDNKSADDNENIGDEVEDKDQPEVQPQCGVQNVSTEQQPTPPWALRIIGGREAAKGRWSWQVAILNKYREVFCGGTLIAPGWVLTAAHCVRKHLFVKLGEHDLIIKEGSEVEYSVLSVVQHPDYNADTVDNDIALLRIPTGEEESNEFRSSNLFESDFDGTRNGRKINNHYQRGGKNVRRGKKSSNSKFSSACLPEQGEVLPEYESAHCMIVGWGKEKNSHVYGTEVLHEAEIPIVSQRECLNVYRDYYISNNMFCAGYKGGRIDSCAGDSGGPLLCQNKQGFWTIYGITSFGEGCGQRYGIYSKVPNYTSWIKSVIKN